MKCVKITTKSMTEFLAVTKCAGMVIFWPF